MRYVNKGHTQVCRLVRDFAVSTLILAESKCRTGKAWLLKLIWNLTIFPMTHICSLYLFMYMQYLKRQLGIMASTLGPVVQNLRKLLANMVLKFLSWNMANTVIVFAEKKNVSNFCIAKAIHIFCSKNVNVFENTWATTVNLLVISKWCFEQVGPGLLITVFRFESHIIAGI